MIAYHIVLNRCRQYFETSNDDDEIMDDYIATLKRNGNKEIYYNGNKKITKINNALIIAFPVVNGIFYSIYFCLTMD